MAQLKIGPNMAHTACHGYGAGMPRPTQTRREQLRQARTKARRQIVEEAVAGAQAMSRRLIGGRTGARVDDFLAERAHDDDDLVGSFSPCGRRWPA